jgi:hypothetical protein
VLLDQGWCRPVEAHAVHGRRMLPAHVVFELFTGRLLEQTRLSSHCCCTLGVCSCATTAPKPQFVLFLGVFVC